MIFGVFVILPSLVQDGRPAFHPAAYSSFWKLLIEKQASCVVQFTTGECRVLYGL
jgi:hypothetical protein